MENTTLLTSVKMIVQLVASLAMVIRATHVLVVYMEMCVSMDVLIVNITSIWTPLSFADIVPPDVLLVSKEIPAQVV